jgi:hypothetical protein
MNSNRKPISYCDLRPQDLEELLRRGRDLRSAYIADAFRALFRRSKQSLSDAHKNQASARSPMAIGETALGQF